MSTNLGAHDRDSANTSLPVETLRVALDLWSQEGEGHFLPLRGFSMLPMLHDGDQVFVSHDHCGSHNGDIVVIQRTDGLVAHRVLRIDVTRGRRTLLTKGDNVYVCDPIITDDELIGRVVVVQYGNRRLNIDTSAWRVIGQLIAALMLMQSRIYRGVGDTEVGQSSKERTRISLCLSIGILWISSTLIKACQAFFIR